MGLTQSKPISTDPKKTAVFFLHNQYSVGRALIFRGWVGRGGGGGGNLEGGANTATPHRNTYKHRTEEHGKRKTGLKLPKISKYRKPLGFVKRQYRNLKITISANRITANPYIPLLVKALTVGIIECCLLASSVVYLRV